MTNSPDDPFVVTQTGATHAEANLLVAFTRMETKVDVVLTQHGAKLEDHETRLRKVEDRPHIDPTKLAVVEERVAEIAARPALSPRALWAGLIGASGVIIAALTFIDKLYRSVG